jgi:hypothetical protein
MFKVRAVNIYGQGAFSTPASFVASNVPEVMSTVTTALIGTTIIRISFTAPDNEGASIDKY